MNISHEQYLQIAKLMQELENDVNSLRSKEQSLRNLIESVCRHTKITGCMASEIINQNRFFDEDNIDRIRILKKAELNSNEISSNAKYIISIDVGRKDDTSVCVFKVLPSSDNVSNKFLVYMDNYSDEPFKVLAYKIKHLVYQYKAEIVVIDGLGLGLGLIDELIRPTQDPQGNIYKPYSVVNDERFDQYRTKDSLPILYILKPTSQLFKEIAINCLQQIESHKIKLLAHEEIANIDVLNDKYITLSKMEKLRQIKPYILTSKLKEQLLNLESTLTGCGDLKLRRINSNIPIDMYHSFSYGLWLIKQQDDLKYRRNYNGER